MKYYAKRVYNNNVVLSEKSNGEEVIFVGKGLAYGMNKGDVINLDKVEKKFELKKDANLKFQDLITEIPMDLIVLCDDVIKYIKESSSKEIDDMIYVSLTDHIGNMVERVQMGIDFDYAILLNIKSLYKEEYQIALHVVSMIRERLNIKIADSEANFITLHIVNAETHSNMMKMYEITNIIDSILSILDQCFSVNKEDNRDYDRFITHCRFFVQRVVNQEYLSEDKSSYEKMFVVLKDLYSNQYECVNRIGEYIEGKYDYKVDDGEKMYLLLHLVKLTS